MRRHRIESEAEYTIHIGLTQPPRCSRPWFVQQAIQALRQKTLPPLAGSLYRDVQRGGRIRIRETIRTEKNDAGPHRQRLRTFGLPGPGTESFAFFDCQ